MSGLAPSPRVDPASGAWAPEGHTTVGRMADSFYEYTLKSWIQNGKSEPHLLTAYQSFVMGVTTRLLARSDTEGLLFVGSIKGGAFVAEMEHRTCFYPATLALAHMHGVKPTPDEVEALAELGFTSQLEVAAELTATCVQMAMRTPTGVAPERTAFRFPGSPWGSSANVTVTRADMGVPYGAEAGMLRAEVAESLFYMYRVTKDHRYRRYGWQLWQGLERSARVRRGYASVRSVVSQPVVHDDKLDAQFLAETMKYMYLLYDDGWPNLREVVFNTEGHAFPINESPIIAP